MKQPGTSITHTPGNPDNTSRNPELTYDEKTVRLERALAEGGKQGPSSQHVPTINTVAIEGNHSRAEKPSSSEYARPVGSNYAVWSTQGVPNDTHFIGNIGHRAEDSLQIDSGDSAYIVTPSPKNNTPPKEEVFDNGFFRPSEDTVEGQKDLLFTKWRSGHITEKVYLAKTANLEQKQQEAIARKKALNSTRPPLTTRVFARLKKFFSGESYKSPFTIPPEQREPTLDTLRTKETPLLTQATNEAERSIYELAKEVPDIDTDVESRYPDHAAILGEIKALHPKQATGKEPHVVTPKKKDLGLSKAELDTMLKVNTEGMSPLVIETLVDRAIKNDIKKLPRYTKKELKELEEKEKLGTWKARLGKVTERTGDKLEATLEKVGPHGNKLISLLARGSEYLDSKVDRKHRILISASLLVLGGMAAYAAPIVLTSISSAAFGMRIISAAGFYTFLRKQLDKKYKEWEQNGITQSSLAKTGREVGIVACAVFGGEIIGQALHGIASTSTAKELLQGAGNALSKVVDTESISNYWSDLWKNAKGFSFDTPEPQTQSTPTSAQPTAQSPVASSPDTTTSSAATPVVSAPELTKASPTLENITTPPNPDLEHTVKKGDTRWSLLRKDLELLKPTGFGELSPGGVERLIRKILDDIAIPPGNIDRVASIQPGQVIDHNGIDFGKYIANLKK